MYAIDSSLFEIKDSVQSEPQQEAKKAIEPSTNPAKIILVSSDNTDSIRILANSVIFDKFAPIYEEKELHIGDTLLLKKDSNKNTSFNDSSLIQNNKIIRKITGIADMSTYFEYQTENISAPTLDSLVAGIGKIITKSSLSLVDEFGKTNTPDTEDSQEIIVSYTIVPINNKNVFFMTSDPSQIPLLVEKYRINSMK